MKLSYRPGAPGAPTPSAAHRCDDRCLHVRDDRRGLDVTNLVERDAAYAWWLALVVGLASTGVDGETGFIDWLGIEWGRELKTATAHLTAMLVATFVFLAAMLVGHTVPRGHNATGAFVVTLAGFVVLTTGGWLGGSLVFVHGLRVLERGGEPPAAD